jgi:hypothetical protein
LSFRKSRCFSTQIGRCRFISVDPAGIDLTDPQTFNRYTYCLNNPHKYLDPDGRLAWFVPYVLGGVLIGAYGGVMQYAATTIAAGEDPTIRGFLGAAVGGGITGGAAILGVALGSSTLIVAGASSLISYIVANVISGEELTWGGGIWTVATSMALAQLFSPLTANVVSGSTNQFVISEAAKLYVEVMASVPFATWLNYKFSQIDFPEITRPESGPYIPPDNPYQTPLI